MPACACALQVMRFDWLNIAINEDCIGNVRKPAMLTWPRLALVHSIRVSSLAMTLVYA